MGIGVGQALLFRAMAKKGVLNSIQSVCELGSQVPIPRELDALFSDLDKRSPNGRYSARQFYGNLGIDEYASIDLNGDHDAKRFDLNKSLKNHYGFHENFDLVTNFGTTEHCFDQAEVLRNIHHLCKPGGYMIHTVPSSGWRGHCFFRYDKNLFEDLTEANGYELLYLDPFIRLQPSRLNTIGLLRNKVVAEMLKTVALTRAIRVNTTLACILKKRVEQDFVIPIQGMYKESCRV